MYWVTITGGDLSCEQRSVFCLVSLCELTVVCIIYSLNVSLLSGS